MSKYVQKAKSSRPDLKCHEPVFTVSMFQSYYIPYITQSLLQISMTICAYKYLPCF